ncbi:MAG: 4'-phosphopantetheinyl transferase [Elusimicrobia bacterium]|nr:MAG: 4'-phosphopantetheinyl transferase [Elusimicrobiota bacterium]KAF0155422.1 MAG: 4'-phosphopantetheinyl transferase [Elusimicrobiota bacterium]
MGARAVFAAADGEGFSAAAARFRAGPCSVVLVKDLSAPSPAPFLSPVEQAACDALKIPKRKAEWLGGRLAAKLAGAGAFFPEVPLREIEVRRELTGSPFLACRGERSHVSISHSAGVCGAAAGPDFLGLDIEETAPRHPGWYRDYFSPAEREGKDEAAMTGLWAAKEALFKALGLGLSCDTLDADLSGPEPVLRGKALARWDELGRPAFVLESFHPAPGLEGRVVFAKERSNKR